MTNSEELFYSIISNLLSFFNHISQVSFAEQIALLSPDNPISKFTHKNEIILNPHIPSNKTKSKIYKWQMRSLNFPSLNIVHRSPIRNRETKNTIFKPENSKKNLQPTESFTFHKSTSTHSSLPFASSLVEVHRATPALSSRKI